MSWLMPCPGCGRNCGADDGHHLCRECEGYPARTDAATLTADLDVMWCITRRLLDGWQVSRTEWVRHHHYQITTGAGAMAFTEDRVETTVEPMTPAEVEMLTRIQETPERES